MKFTEQQCLTVSTDTENTVTFGCEDTEPKDDFTGSFKGKSRKVEALYREK